MNNQTKKILKLLQAYISKSRVMLVNDDDKHYINRKGYPTFKFSYILLEVRDILLKVRNQALNKPGLRVIHASH